MVGDAGVGIQSLDHGVCYQSLAVWSPGGEERGGERRSRHLPCTGAHVRGRWRDHTGLWGHWASPRDFAGERVNSPAMLVFSAQHWCNQSVRVTDIELYRGLVMG